MNRALQTRQTGRRRRDARGSRESTTAGETAREQRLAALHGAGGNQAVGSTLEEGRVDRATDDGGSRRGPAVTRDLCPRCLRRYRAGKPLDCEECESALDGGRESVGGESTTEAAVQPKLEVSDPDDRHEREAERVAEAVMRSEDPSRPGDGTAQVAIQRMCPRCRRRARQGRPLDCEECEAELQRAAKTGGETTVDGDTARQIRVARSGGRPLGRETRSFFESRLGRDFDDVRVHTGAQADRAARSVNARAFTLGSDVVFRSGEYRPGTEDGKRLLAHELTHVVQQGGGRELSQPSETSADAASRAEATIPEVKRRDDERIQRLDFGVTWAVDSSAGPAPPKFSMIPDEDKARVKPAVAIVDRIVENRNDYPECHEFFANHCPDGNEKTLPKIHKNATLWKLPGAPRGTYGETDSSTPEDIAYTEWAHQVGRWTIASTIIHEYTHTCGADHPHGPSTDQNLGEQAVIACGLPPISEIE